MWPALVWIAKVAASVVAWSFMKPTAALVTAAVLYTTSLAFRKDTKTQRFLESVAYTLAVPAAVGLVYSWLPGYREILSAVGGMKGQGTGLILTGGSIFYPPWLLR
jgi:hypothetical protein